ncbi:MAG: glucose-6-phosphate dehydrogenase [Candidatus Eiseniibacteriota bacterium]
MADVASATTRASRAVAPFREGLTRDSVAPPACLVIFGATGDLTSRKLLPALYHLKKNGLLPAHFAVVGYARKELDDAAFAESLRSATAEHARTPLDPALWQDFAEGLSYVTGDFADAAGFERLAKTLERIDRERGTEGNRLFYFATPPTFYPILFENLGHAGLLEEKDGRFARIIVEKPFGRDLESARALNEIALRFARERQIFRIDHYLGKETVQNILVFRFGNAIFEPLWNQKYVDHVQITVGESIGVEGRGRFYEEAGALRDIVQNHLLQLVTLMAMEPPGSFEADPIRDEKVKVLRAVPHLTPRDVPARVVRGQYGAGSVGGTDVVGYREEEGVAKDSGTETFVALELAVDNWRWAGVPFFVRAGKRLPKRVTEIAVQFKRVPHSIFGSLGGAGSSAPEPNVLALRIQPEEGISLKFGAKIPGPRVRVEPVKMDFLYGSSFGVDPPEAYERLLLDALLGDSTLFIRRDEVEAAWSIVTPILEAWSDAPPPAFPDYDAGTWGPEPADALLDRTGRSWRRP